MTASPHLSCLYGSIELAGMRKKYPLLESNALIEQLFIGFAHYVQSLCEQRIRKEQVKSPPSENSHSLGNWESLPSCDSGSKWSVFDPLDIWGEKQLRTTALDSRGKDTHLCW